MQSFEPDFLVENFNCVPAYRSNVTAATMWLDAIDAAARAEQIAVQLCMASPTDLLHALRLRAVTNFRASTDYYYGRSWDLGLSSLLIWALGAAPSKDTFWTSDNGADATTMGGCPPSGCPDDHTNTGSELHTVIALMSTGPVGFSDAVNRTNVTLLRRTCRDDGALLQPSKPLTAIDASLLGGGPGPASGERVRAAAPAPNGFVLSSFSGRAARRRSGGIPTAGASPRATVGAGKSGEVWAYYVLDHQLETDYVLRARDVWPPLRVASSASSAPASQGDDDSDDDGDGDGDGDGDATPNFAHRTHAVARCADGASAAACGVTFVAVAADDADAALATLTATPRTRGKYAARLTTLVPLCASSSGLWAFFGEIAKFASLSAQRFTVVECDGAGGGVAFEITGIAGERVDVTAAVRSGANESARTVTLVVGADGTARGAFPPRTSA
jgi:hypothetical protein